MKKILISVTAIVALLLIMMIVIPILFKDQIIRQIKTTANHSLKSELNFGDISLSFFSHFPNLTLEISDFYLKSAPSFPGDTLVSARKLGFGINLKSLFSEKIIVNKVFLDRASIWLKYNEQGLANFDVYQSGDTTSVAETDTATGSTLSIEDITFTNCRLIYADASIGFGFSADGLNYSGKSAYSGNVFDVESKVKIDSLDVSYDGNELLSRKPVTAKMNTRINSDDLTIFFEKNDLKIKDIPLQFNGKFNFEPDGYTLSLSLLSVMEKEFLSARLKMIQGKALYVAAKATASVDLERWSVAFGYRGGILKGMYDLSLMADGYYQTGPVKVGRRGEVDTVVVSIPKFELLTKITGGYFKYHDLPQAISNISFDLNAKCPDHNYKNLTVQLDKLRAGFLNNTIEGRFALKDFESMTLEADLNGGCDLGELKEVIPLDSLDLAGRLDLKVNVSGSYLPEEKKFPVTTANILWKDGLVKSGYYPNAIKKISMAMEVKNSSGRMDDLEITIDPFNFSFEGKPFTLTAHVADLADVRYDIQSKGVLDLGRIYKVFSREGMELEGYIETDLSLKGRQSDAMAMRLDRLQNKGTLKMKDIAFSADDYPKPFIIRTGDFRFDQDDIRFENFYATYGYSDFALKGSVKNSIAWMLGQGKTLRGNFELKSKLINVNEFMTNAPESGAPPEQASAGVVIIPRDLDIDFRASIGQVTFSGLDIRDLKGDIDLKEGILVLSKAGFNLIGCNVDMDATYGSINPEKAHFDFHIKAEDFDIHKAWQEIAMVREMASSAEKAEGIVSLDYALKGMLDATMYPILPSIEGGGTLSVKKVKVSGLKLFSDISKSTEREGLANPDMTKVDIKSTIKNKTVTVEQFKFKVSGIRFKVSGSSTFDNVLNLRIRLGLPPLGIFGIPLKVTGPMENLKIKYGRGKESEDIPDSEYSEELPAEMLQRIKNAKDDGGED